MDQKIPFTSYDFWAYLSAGFLVLFAADHVAGTALLSRDSWTVVQGVVAVSCAYAVGQVVASASAYVFERGLVGAMLGYPRNVLFGKPTAWKVVRLLLPGYFKGLPNQTTKLALDKGKLVGIDGPGEALFWAAFANARAIPVVMSRLDNFLNLYGFCRNIALVSFINGAMLYWSYRWGKGQDVNLYWSWGSAALGVGMTLRYLKFYRHYAVEVFTSYAHSKEATEKK